jgi:hypothetical protein
MTDVTENTMTGTYAVTALKIRADALREAVALLSFGHLRPSTMPDYVGRCPHKFNDERCDCPSPSQDEIIAAIHALEQDSVDQVIRIAGHFANWIEAGITPDEYRSMQIDDAMAELTGDEPT